MVRKRADLLLVERGLFESRAKARAAIEAGGVVAAGQPVGRASDLLDEAVELAAEPAHPWVGRGALKLAHALEIWPVQVAGRVVLDVGASTGGFTEVCLHAGARKVFAVDVGRSQLHPRLVADQRVVNLQGLDARDLTSELVTEPPGLIVTDVSFISLAKALGPALDLAAPGAELVALVKPQFEVGPDRVGKGGIVKDREAQDQALADAGAFVAGRGWRILATAESPIAGGDGNREFLLWASR
jgi:23S rRNA (cytidine1920-2'-O)/16S rRNA (cytidine1409-2'-O)-methyltransferase